MKSVFEKFDLHKFSNTQLGLVLQILIEYNPRISEILTARWKDFYPGKFLILNGAKKSSNVIIRDREILHQIENLPQIDSTFIFPSITYSKIYHFIKSRYSHQFIHFKKRKNFKVTHAFRYENVSQLDNDEKIRDVLHHRSVKSGKFYKLKQGDTKNGKNS